MGKPKELEEVVILVLVVEGVLVEELPQVIELVVVELLDIGLVETEELEVL